tara:strand:- start:302 stop:847 length:546 start_codon:yes stop_codon:yes gene_type:complete
MKQLNILEKMLFQAGAKNDELNSLLATTTNSQINAIFTEFMRDIFNDKHKHFYDAKQYARGIGMLVGCAIDAGKGQDYLDELDFFCTRSYGATKDNDLSIELLVEFYHLVNADNTNFETFTQLKLLIDMQQNIIQPIVEKAACMNFSTALDAFIDNSASTLITSVQGQVPDTCNEIPSNAI